MSERDERLASRGPQGEQGETGKQGERGAAGLSKPVRRALVFLFVLCVLMAGSNILWTAYVVRAGNQARCASILADAHIPLPEPVAGNPSREWEAAFEAIQEARARQLGCA